MSRPETTENDAIVAIRAILQRYDSYCGRLNVPGDWGERVFRGWLMTDLLMTAQGWPSALIVIGERFDILLLDSTLHPVVNIETKKPYHKTTAKDWNDFESRLSFYKTLRWAFLTNGQNWTRLALLAPGGKQTITDRTEIDIRTVVPQTANDFFRVMHADQFNA